VSLEPRPLRRADLHHDPVEQFRAWYDDAVAHGQPQADAMTVASTTLDGRPSARQVLLRGVDGRGFCFYTNFESRKARELDANPYAAIVFHWPAVLRQVRVTGRVERVDDGETDAYWASRPRASQLSAWASEQSEVVGNREELEARVEEIERGFAEIDVPRPAWWGGYRVVPVDVEFWQHRDDRLHDRFRYSRRGEGWTIDRLQP
jgi:pyridoxamine 5'-phosphate oxidase